MTDDTLTEQVREFLTSRRARLTPERAGLPAWAANRRVAGLRREEVAMLAGVSVDYYTRVERGRLRGVSDEVLDAISGALQLDEAEVTYLCDLATACNQGRQRRTGQPREPRIRPSVQRFLDAITEAPAYVRNERMDILAANDLGRALYAPMLAGVDHPNSARFTFLDARAQVFFRDWAQAANDSVAILRSAAGRAPHDRQLHDLVGELCTRSAEFAERWARHDVRLHRTGVKRMHHDAVGDLDLAYEVIRLEADPGLVMFVYTAEPHTPSAEGLALLASLAATERRDAAHVRR